MDTKRLTEAELEFHGSWIRGLAFAILRDRALAEDVSQEVLIKALEGRPRSRGALRAWLAAMTRNLSRNQIRERSRRSARERRVAKPERDGGQVTSLELLEAHQAVVDALRCITPKHREVLMLRFHQSLEFDAVARKLKISEVAARKRVHRALEELRGTFGRGGNTERLCGVVLGPALLAEAMRRHSLRRVPVSPLLALAGLAVVTTIALNLPADDADGSSGLAADSQETHAGLPTDGGGDAQAVDLLPIREELVQVESASEVAERTAKSVPLALLTGIVVDGDVPVDAAVVHVETDDERVSAVTAADGTFSLRANPSGQPTVWAEKNGRVGIPLGNGMGSSDWPARIQLKARGVEHWLTIRDSETKRPLANAEVVLREWRGPATESSWEGRPIVARLRTDADGTVELEGPLAARRLLLGVDVAGYYSRIRASNPRATSVNRQILMHRAPSVRPRIVRPDGRVLAGLRVVQWTGTTAVEAVTDAEGRVGGPLLAVTERGPLFWIQDTNGSWVEDTALERRGADGSDLVLPVLTAVEMRMVEGTLPEGTWLEARNATGWAWSVRMTNGPFGPTRVDPEQPTRLAGSFSVQSKQHNRISLRLQPNGQYLEDAHVENGVALVRLPHLPWVRFRVQDEEAGAVAEGWELFLDPEIPVAGLNLSPRGTVEDGLVELFVPPGRWLVRLGPPVHERTARTSKWAGVFLTWDGAVMRALSGPGVLLEILSDATEIPLVCVMPRLEPASVRLGGRPVSDGTMRTAGMYRWLDFDGGCEIVVVDGVPAVPQGLWRRNGRLDWSDWGSPPIPISLRLDWADPLHWRRGDGEANWQLDIPIAEAELLWSDALRTGPLEYLGRNRSGAWSEDWQLATVSTEPGLPIRFRLPPGRYRFRLGRVALSPPEGVRVEEGLLTALEPWGVPLEEALRDGTEGDETGTE